MKRHCCKKISMPVLLSIVIVFSLVVTNDTLAEEEVNYLSAMQAGARVNTITDPVNGFIKPTPSRKGEVFFSLPVYLGDYITEIAIIGDGGTVAGQYNNAVLIEKHPGWYGSNERGSVKQYPNEKGTKWLNITDVTQTVHPNAYFIIRVDLYSPSLTPDNKLYGIAYKVKPAPKQAEEKRAIAAVHAGSQYLVSTQSDGYAYIIPQYGSKTGEIWFSLPVKEGDIITEIGLSGPIHSSAAMSKKLILVEKHPGWSGGTEIASLTQIQGNYYMVSKATNYLVPAGRGVLLKVELSTPSGYVKDNTFTGVWYKVKPAAGAEKLKFISPMHSAQAPTEQKIAPQFGDKYAYVGPSIAGVPGTIWLQLPVIAGDVITELGLSGFTSGSGTIQSAIIYEQDPNTNTFTEIKTTLAEQKSGAYYIVITDIPDYTVPSGKIILAKINLYSAADAMTGFWWKIVSQNPSSQTKLAVILLENVTTCIVGNTGNDCTFGGVGFAEDVTLAALKPSDSRVNNYPQKVCVNMQLTPTDINNIKLKTAEFAWLVNNYTSGALIINPEFISVSGEIEMARPNKCSFWPAPWNIEEYIDNYITKETDFIITTYNVNSNMGFIDMGAGGWTYGAYFGINGAGYSVVPKDNYTKIGEADDYVMNEWLLQVQDALHYVMKINDIYYIGTSECWPGSITFPACSISVDPYSYFPGPENCQRDPDYTDCGQSYCVSTPGNYYKHLLDTHYNPEWSFIGNHCRNKIMDCGESNIDCGGRCDPCS